MVIVSPAIIPGVAIGLCVVMKVGNIHIDVSDVRTCRNESGGMAADRREQSDAQEN